MEQQGKKNTGTAKPVLTTTFEQRPLVNYNQRQPNPQLSKINSKF
jgi:hypothetical protein